MFNARPLETDCDSLEADARGDMQLNLLQDGGEFPNNSWYFVFNSTNEGMRIYYGIK